MGHTLGAVGLMTALRTSVSPEAVRRPFTETRMFTAKGRGAEQVPA